MRPLRYSINVALDGCCDHRAMVPDEELHRHAALPAPLEAIEADTRALGFGMASERGTGSLLRTLAASKPGGRLLELGTGTGLATSWILDGMDAASTLLSVDGDGRVQEVARRHLGGDPRVRFAARDGGALLLEQQAEGAAFDLVFADARPGKYTHLDVALALVAAGGFYVVDDLLEQPGWPEGHRARVAGLVEALVRRPDFHPTPLTWSTGVVVATRRLGGPGRSEGPGAGAAEER